MAGSPFGSVRSRSVAVLSAALALVWAAVPAAHEIPTDVTVQAFVKPEGQRLRLIVRVPLAALRDVAVPVRADGSLDLGRADAVLRDAALLWIGDVVELREGEARLGAPSLAAARVSLPSDRSFGSYEEALAHVTGQRLADDVAITWSQGLLDVLFEYPIQSERSRFSLRPGLERLGERVVVALRFLPPSGAVRAFEFGGDPGLVRLDPRWHQAALRFVELGFWHIIGGGDHLLFLFCLVIPFRRVRALIVIVTSFTVAHSITLIASASRIAPDVLWFPPLIETLIATSILYMAIENVVGPGLQRRWLIAFGFGLVHGFGFSLALRQTLQFAGSHLLTSLLAFNVGVEIGQLLVLALLIPALELAFRLVIPERVGTIILSALVAHTGWHWALERADRLRQFRFVWPAFDLALVASVMRWLMLLLVVAGAIWLLFGVARHLAPQTDRREAAAAED